MLMSSAFSSEAHSFVPGWSLRNRHVQTLAAFINVDAQGIEYDRRRITTPDGDFIDIDIPYTNRFDKPIDDVKRPIIFVLPGFRGDVRSGNSPCLLKNGIKLGFCPIGLNYRGCSGEQSHRPSLTHLRATLDDIVFALNWVKKSYPKRKIGVVGFSLGSIFLINMLGQKLADVDAAVGISPAFNLASSIRYLSQGKYNRWVLNHFKNVIRERETDFQNFLDIEQVFATRNMVEFNELCIEAFGNGHCVESYHNEVSPDRWIPHVQTPTLLIRAIDDPFFDPTDIPFEKLEANPNITPVITRYGGHVGFFCKLRGKNSWAAQSAVHFLQQKLDVVPVEPDQYCS